MSVAFKYIFQGMILRRISLLTNGNNCERPEYIAPIAKNLTYNGSSQELLTAGSTNDGTIYYSIDNSTWGVAVPSGINAGSYTVYWKLVANEGYCDIAPNTINVTIAKVTPTVVAPTAKVLTYNAQAQALVNAGSTDYGTLQYNVSGDSWSTSIPTMTRGGSYTVQYRVVGDSNINDVAAQSVQCSINEKQVTATVTLSQTAYTYNGSACEPSVTVSDGGVIIDPSEYTVTYSNNINAGTGTVTISDNVGGDYEVIGSSTFTINKANSSLSFTVTNIRIIVGDTSSNVVTVNAGDGTVTYSSNDTSVVAVDNNGSITGVSVGNAVITASISSTSNYNSASTSYTSSCIVRAKVTAKYNVTSTSSPTMIGYNNYTSGFSSIEIDGVKQPSVVSAYTFSTTGEHTVEYTLTDPTSIGNYAFWNCSGLTSVTIPDSVTSIGEYAFYYCSSLTSCTIGSGVTIIDIGAFYGCNSLTSITIPDSVTSIGSEAFDNCSGLTSVTIPDSVTSIGDRAFQSCYSLTSVTIPDSVTSIGNRAFYYCSGLTSIDIPDSVTSIGNSAFTYCSSLTSIDIPDSVTSIGQYTFYNCSSLTSIDIPDSVTSIGNRAFLHCSGLTSVTIGSGVTSIGQYAFDNCSGLTSIDVLDNVTSVGVGAFRGCSSLTSCTIGSGVTSISEGLFSDCINLKRLNSNADGVFNIPSTITKIDGRTFDKGSFYMCYSVRSIDIPDSVTSIGSEAFDSCSGLTSCTIGSGVTSIGAYAFYNCRSLSSITIPSGVTSIDTDVFRDCRGLTSIDIPDSVTSIGSEAFYNCHSLTSITSNATTAPTIQSSTFQNVKSSGTLTVPIGSSGYDVWMGTGDYYLGKYNWTKVEQ